MRQWRTRKGNDQTSIEMYILPPLPEKKKPRPAHRKSDAIKILEAMANADQQRRHPSIDPRYLAPYRYSDKTANSRTKCVIDFIRLSGFQAERINCTGRYVDNTEVVLDVLDRHRVIGSAKWVPTSGQKGTSDISAVIRGRAVKIEIKANSDRQRPDQAEYQKQIEQSGGIYLIIKSFAEFYDWYQSNQL